MSVVRKISREQVAVKYVFIVKMRFLKNSFRLLTDDHCVLCVPIDAVIGAIVVGSASLDRSDDASGVKI